MLEFSAPDSDDTVTEESSDETEDDETVKSSEDEKDIGESTVGLKSLLVDEKKEVQILWFSCIHIDIFILFALKSILIPNYRYYELRLGAYINYQQDLFSVSEFLCRPSGKINVETLLILYEIKIK